MNPIEAMVRAADGVQQRNKALGFVFGVIKKFGDDNGGVLVANLAYAGFVSLFPLLLILATILGLVASSNPDLQRQVRHAVTDQVPLIGAELNRNVHELRQASIVGLIVGIAVLVWGTTRLAQAGIFAMEQVWNLPGPARPGFFPRLVRSAVFLAVLGLGVIVTTLLSGLSSFGHQQALTTVATTAAAAVTNAGMFVIVFRVLSPAVGFRRLWPGAVAGGIVWTALQALGTHLVRYSLHSSAVYGVFATVLGLLAWVYLSVEIVIYAAEINVVLTRRLWPRAMVQPPLTEADRASMALQALQNQRREEQQVRVTFNDRPEGVRRAATTPRTPEDVLWPHRGQRARDDKADGEKAGGEKAGGAGKTAAGDDARGGKVTDDRAS
jgi:YihY family inner membrane protein